MFRSWTWWLTLLFLTLGLGYFWQLGRNVTFQRTDPNNKPPSETQP